MRRWFALALALVLALLALLCWAIWQPAPGAVLEAWFVDVGEADCCILRCGDQVMMVDGGNVADSQLVYAILRDTLRIDHIDIMVATHPHEDHVGGLAAALNACTVEQLLTPTTEYDSKAFRSMVKYANEQGTQINIPKPGQRLRLGAAAVTILGPLRDYAETNDQSIVLRIDLGRTSMLLTGDIEAQAERDLLASGARLDADLLKVAHHGSATSSRAEWLRAVRPEVAVISVSHTNGDSHPAQSTLECLRGVGAKTLRTDQAGTLHCVMTDREIEISVEERF